jgi:DNA repair protein RadD
MDVIHVATGSQMQERKSEIMTDTIVDGVIQAVLDQGILTKAQIQETWGIGEEDYKELRNRVLARQPAIRKGPPGVGGLKVGKHPGKHRVEVGGNPLLVRTDWEQGAVARLSELLSRGVLEDLLGPLLQSLRHARLAESGSARRSTKQELAAALLLNHGVDLFFDRDIRRAVAKATRVSAPSRWYPGKRAAIRFVSDAGFPRELAGIPAEDASPDHEYFDGRSGLPPLLDFQSEVKDELDRTLRSPGERALVTLPTGAGKTLIAVESIRDLTWARFEPTDRVGNASVVLWLAHTDELCEQACACFRQVWQASDGIPPLLLVRLWGRYTRDLAMPRKIRQESLSRMCVLVSTPQRIVNLLGHRTEAKQEVVRELRKNLRLLVIDEAHRAAAWSYRRLIEDLVTEDRAMSVVGLTATPFREVYHGRECETGTAELKAIFRRLIQPTATLGENPRACLQQMGVLAQPIFETILTNLPLRLPDLARLQDLSEEELKRLDRILAFQADNTQRRLAIFKRILPIAQQPENSILYFGPTVQDAESMSCLLQQRGVKSAVISGRTRDATRRRTVADFKAGRIRVVCSCEALTTGFDAPVVSHVVMARPTTSLVLLEQLVGRGLRGPRFGGTESCVILDCADNYEGDRPELGYSQFQRVWCEQSAESAPSNCGRGRRTARHAVNASGASARQFERATAAE